MKKVTPEYLFLNRRKFTKSSLAAGSALLFPFHALGAKLNEKFKLPQNQITKEALATSYNNFYEFSLDKDGVAPAAKKWTLPSVWKIEVSGLSETTGSFTVSELMEMAKVKEEERIYRFRCVEAWSMVVPWSGFPLADLVKALKPKTSAKFIKFTTFTDKKAMPNISGLPQYPWPYTEGLTLAEAQNPLTLLATGMYGKPLPKQNGAPIRLIVPWKYGFKSIKSISKIEFTEKQPETLWQSLAPDEYGFYANVNPNVDHPRWSQASERILDNAFFPKRKPTLMFNGYEKDVASLYAGLDLKKNY